MTNTKGGIAIVAHKFNHHPDDDLILYLNKRKKFVVHILHSFPDAKDRKSYYKLYANGKQTEYEETWDFMGYPSWLIYLKEMFFTFYVLFKYKKSIGIYIGMDGLCALWGNLFRMPKVIYWVIDFVPTNRFSNFFANNIYKFINTFSYKYSDEVWDLSPRMQEAREKYWGLPKNFYKKISLVPYGVWTERINPVSYNDCEKNTIVFMGHLIEKQGVQHVINILPQLLQKNPNIKFKIIGKGPYYSTLVQLAKEKGVLESCMFRDDFDNDKDFELEQELSKSCVAVAPYDKTLDTWTYYADPGKVKKYIACGVPVVMTNISWNSKEIERVGCGLLLKDDFSNLADQIIKAMSVENQILMRINSLNYAKTFNYENIFNRINL